MITRMMLLSQQCSPSAESPQPHRGQASLCLQAAYQTQWTWVQLYHLDFHTFLKCHDFRHYIVSSNALDNIAEAMTFSQVSCDFIKKDTWERDDSVCHFELISSSNIKSPGWSRVIFSTPWWYSPILTAYRRLRKEFGFSLGYTVRLCLKEKANKQKQKKNPQNYYFLIKKF